jgi:two-component system cell cycle response regulator
MSARILVIEDNTANLDLMTCLLEAFGHVAITARDGKQGLERVRCELPDLVLCDVQMPGADGYSVAKAMKSEEALRAIPLIAVTALAMVGDREQTLAAGFDGYISKPIEPEIFVAQVDQFLRPEQRSQGAVRAGAESPVVRVASRRATILVVDDQQVNLVLKRSILEPFGYQVFTASGMAEALGVIRTVTPDLILSDLGMGDASGFDFIAAVKGDARLKPVPFILITATHRGEATRSKGLALGAARFLFRPIEPEALLAEIEACLAERTGV